ncbi:uncharacterized protein BP01DRAFT_67909 [Aspergillus saccharolyticus JOP 1030-1]|uniref:Uncharacterized protein n=1 Tax=Aspergillus saccharolyticus JOP 1030-1 TaxID=1450539 RepID=A0A318ZWM4_9EURO|nr:hypothetical protein BP01DRAFT_67909 [Aspergillus saccharolyticus JOP 1030-1]PYH44528.1 hypothetical protein BP01DRAFT_67909 [Aspergillus saccharolyticus JOP 1030-1]
MTRWTVVSIFLCPGGVGKGSVVVLQLDGGMFPFRSSQLSGHTRSTFYVSFSAAESGFLNLPDLQAGCGFPLIPGFLGPCMRLSMHCAGFHVRAFVVVVLFGYFVLTLLYITSLIHLGHAIRPCVAAATGGG